MLVSWTVELLKSAALYWFKYYIALIGINYHIALDLLMVELTITGQPTQRAPQISVCKGRTEFKAIKRFRTIT